MKKSIHRIGWIGIFCLLQTTIFAQLQIIPASSPSAPFTTTSLIANAFLGSGVQVVNVTYSGDNRSVGYFQNGTAALGMDRGIMLSTGRVIDALGPNTDPGTIGNPNDVTSGLSDADLAAISGTSILDAAIYTIDFIPSADTLEFKYVFGSDEYDEFVCSINDAFGFFISGPGITGPFTNNAQNIALVPGTTTGVSINTINNGGNGCSPTNSQYYINNNNGTGHEFDAYTTVLTARVVVTPCQQYRIKLVIGDAVDDAINSGVFMEANSFSAEELTVSASPTTLTEGCSQGQVDFKLVNPAASNYAVSYTIGGTATNGVDYAAIPATATIPAGQDSISFSIVPTQDFVTEGNETIELIVNTSPCETDTIVITITEGGSLTSPNMADTTICATDSAMLNATPNVVLPANVTFTNTTSGNFNFGSVPLVSSINVSNVTPLTIGAGTVVSVCLDITHNNAEDVDVFLVAPNGDFMELMSDNGGSGNNFTNTCFTATSPQKIVSGVSPMTGNFLPEGNWNALYGGPTNGIWELRITDDSNNGMNGVLNNWSITFPPPYFLTYDWTPVDGLSCDDCAIPNASPNTTTTYIARIIDNYGCAVEDTVVVNVTPALNKPTISCDSASGNTLVVSWGSVANATGYEVQVDNNGWIPANGTLTHTVLGLDTVQTVDFKIRAIGNNCDAINLIDSIQCTTLSCDLGLNLDSTFNPLCNGDVTGRIYTSATDGTPPYLYAIDGNTPKSTGDFIGLTVGTHTIVVTDDAGCSATQVVTITQPLPLITAPVQTNVSCNSGNDGTIALNTSGGTAPFNFQWNGTTQTTDTIQNLVQGIYNVTITDDNGCFVNQNYTITQPTALTATLSADSVNCNGGNDGFAAVTVSGGSFPYTYSWNTSPIQTTDTAFNLSAGTYTVTITDSLNCVYIDSIVVAEPDVLSLVGNSTQVSCHGAGDGTANVTVTGGTLNYSYLWNTTPVQTTPTATGLSGGNYQVIVTDGNGCQDSITVNVLERTALNLSDTLSTPTSCYGIADGTGRVTPTGGIGPYTYLWNTSPAQTDSLAIGLLDAFYTVTVTDADGCQDTVSVFIVAPRIVQATATTHTDNLCFGGNIGKASAIGTGGTNVFNYTWNSTPVQTGDTAFNLIAGVYTVTATDGNGCIGVDSTTITEPTILQSSMSFTPLLCNNDGTGTATISQTGGVAPYNFAWSTMPVQTDTTAINLQAGMYYVTVTDANNCQHIDSVEVTEPTALNITLTSTQVSCNGAGDGTTTVAVLGGSMPYTYNWSSLQTTTTATGLNGGMHYVTVTDANNCSVIDSVFVLERPALSNLIDSVLVSCNGVSDASIVVMPSGGTGIYTYSWNTTPPRTDSLITGLASGSYIVTITDSDNCSIVDMATISEPAVLTLALDSINVSCNGFGDGIGIAIPSGGTLPYTYLWNTSETTDSIKNLVPGNYSVTVTDANNCTVSAALTISEPQTLTATLSAMQVSCNGAADGIASATVVGGTMPYNYNWSGTTQTTAMVNGLSGGMHYLTVTDFNGCIYSDSVFVLERTPIDLSDTLATPTTCFGVANGTGRVTPTGGIGPYTYLWNTSPAQTDSLATGLLDAFYRVTVTDADGCWDSVSVFVVAPRIVQAFPVTEVNNVCYDGNIGSVSSTATGGSNSFSYTWNTTPQQVGDTIFNLMAGVYTVTASDGNGCIGIDSTTITQPDSMILTMNSTATLCFGSQDGIAEVSVTGGTPDGNGAYSFAWNTSPSQLDSIAENVATGTYTVSVTDGNACLQTNSVFVSEPTIVASSMSMTPVICNGDSSGTATIVASGGVGNYTYNWNTSPPQNMATAINLPAGWHFVTVTDGNNCSKIDSIEVTEPTLLISSTTMTGVTCNGDADGTATAVAAGGIGPYTYVWSNAQAGGTITNLNGGMYYVTATDANNCIKVDSIMVYEPDVLVAVMDSIDVLCFGDSTGKAVATAQGGTGSFVYSWNTIPAQNTDTAIGLPIGNYTVTITDANNCVATNMVTVEEPTPVNVVGTIITPVACHGDSTGTGLATSSGGVGGYTYLWTPTGQTTATASNLWESSFAVQTSDANGCMAFDTIYMPQPTPHDVMLTTTNVSCNGGNDGAITVSNNGATPPYSYIWNTSPIQTSATATNLTAGIYMVTVLDANNCGEVATATVTEPLIPLIDTISMTQVHCFGEQNGTATIVVSGGTPSANGTYQYQWSTTPTQFMPTAIQLGAGKYFVTVTDANNCVLIDSIEVTQPDALTLALAQDSVNCYGGNDGFAYAMVTGGTTFSNGNYNYSWNPTGQITDTATALLGDSVYTVLVTDSMGCTISNSIMVLQPAPITLSISNTDIDCFGADNGTATVSTLGGTMPYNYLWDNGQTVATSTNLTPGTHTVLVSDYYNCTKSISTIITQPTDIDIDFTTVDVLCKGDATGEITATVSGATPTYSYQWSVGSSSIPYINLLTADTYYLTVTDGNNCNFIDSITINEPNEVLSATIDVTDIRCFGEKNGAIHILPSGGTPAYQYSFDGVNYNNVSRVTGLSENDYLIYLRDANGCEYSDLVYVAEPDELLVDLGDDKILKFGDSLTLSPMITAGKSPFTYQWSPDTSISCATCLETMISNLYQQQLYHFIVTDSNGCMADDYILLTPDKPSDIYVATAFSPNGDNVNDALYIQGSGFVTEVVNLQVYDRWGERLFESNNTAPNNPQLGWDGTFKGKPMNPGVYGWFAKVKFADGNTISFKGNITLVR